MSIENGSNDEQAGQCGECGRWSLQVARGGRCEDCCEAACVDRDSDVIDTMNEFTDGHRTRQVSR